MVMMMIAMVSKEDEEEEREEEEEEEEEAEEEEEEGELQYIAVLLWASVFIARASGITHSFLVISRVLLRDARGAFAVFQHESRSRQRSRQEAPD